MRKVHATIIGIALSVALAVPAGAHPWGGHQQDECDGLAPAVVICTTGLHFRFPDDATFRHGFTGVGEDYTGAVTSRLVYVGGERTFTCEYEGGALVANSCAGAGDFPPPQTYFTQMCESHEPGTTNPGGSGQWGCFMEHG